MSFKTWALVVYGLFSLFAVAFIFGRLTTDRIEWRDAKDTPCIKWETYREQRTYYIKTIPFRAWTIVNTCAEKPDAAIISPP